MKSADDRPIALVGIMGAGKSAVARALGERLGTSVADLDAMIEAVEGCSVAELFERAGEAWFREREGQMLEEVLLSCVQVIACGGGIVLDPLRRAALRERCRVVWLEVPPAEAARRVLAQSPHAGKLRPLLAGGSPQERLTELLNQRRSMYAEAAHIRIQTGDSTPEQVADAIASALAANA
ncbi:MAG: shikimate kinase [Candidatus Eisenbacteria bacterium]